MHSTRALQSTEPLYLSPTSLNPAANGILTPISDASHSIKKGRIIFGEILASVQEAGYVLSIIFLVDCVIVLQICGISTEGGHTIGLLGVVGWYYC